MSDIPRLDLGELDGTHGFVKTRGYVNWVDDVSTRQPHQRIGLGYYGDSVVCTVWSDHITLEQGEYYWLGGVDATYDPYEEVQLQLGESSWANTPP